MRRQADMRLAKRSAVRRAFTLVEILVVVAVIGILLTVIALASVRALAGARVQQTRSTIKKIDEMLSRRTAAFERAMTGRNLAGGNATESELLGRYENLRLGDDAIRRKRLFGRFFGQTFGETFQYANTTVIPNFAADLTTAELAEAGFVSANHKPETESSEMLYWSLVHGPTFGADVVEADSFNSSEVADTDGDGLMEFIDAWGKPLRFYRWPTRVLRPGPPSDPETQGAPYHALGPATGGQLSSDAPATFLMGGLPSYNTTPDESLADVTMRPSTPLGQDSDDQYGEIFLSYMQREAGGFSSAAAAAQRFETQYHTLNTWHAPLIVSVGPDGVLGMFEPNDRTNFGHLAQPMANSAGTAYSEALQDNVTNLNGQASGTGGQ